MNPEDLAPLVVQPDKLRVTASYDDMGFCTGMDVVMNQTGITREDIVATIEKLFQPLGPVEPPAGAKEANPDPAGGIHHIARPSPAPPVGPDGTRIFAVGKVPMVTGA